MTHPALQIDGAVRHPLSLSFDDLSAFPSAAQIADVSRFHPKRQGQGVTLAALLERAEPLPHASYLTLHASADDFHASIPLAAVCDEGVVVYRLAGEPLPARQGGPFRFLIRDPAACHTDELDDCANVKFVDRIELTVGKGRDNRPETDDEHARLHGE